MSIQNYFAQSASIPFSAVRPGHASAPNAELWRVIWIAGGLCWLCVAVIGVLWFLPTSGTVQGNDRVMSSGARLLHHFLLFLLAAPAYRIGIGLGWPATALPRLRVIVVNVILALLVIRVAPLLQLVSSAALDAASIDFAYGLSVWGPFHATVMQWMLLFRLWLPAYVLALIAIALVVTARRSHRDSVRLADLSAQLANARLATLSAQLHPHFLFNSLHAISGLVTDSPAQAVEMIARLGDFLRIAIESTKYPWTSVEAEVLGVEAYLAVQRSRFRDRLHVIVRVEPQSLTARIPALLLQPLVENAIEHGLAAPDESLEVTVAIRRSQNRLIIIVTNSIPAIREPLVAALFGNGLRNVSARLHAAYNGDAWINIGPDLVCGTRAELNVPTAVKERVDVTEWAN
jgi:two-component system LytT family sensor kinase